MPEIYESFHALLSEGATTAAVANGTTLLGARYGEWVDGHGEQQAGFLRWQEFFSNQVDLAHAVDGFVGADDVAVVAAPYELAFIGHVVERALELIGTTLIGIGTSNTICPMPRALNLMRRYGVSALVSSPSLVLELAREDQALSEDGDRHALRSLVFIGEACSPKRLDRIADLWGARPLPLFGTAAMPVIATPCGYGELHLTEDWLSADLRDPSEARVAGGGQRGELLLEPAGPSAEGGEVTATGELVELWPRDRNCVCGDASRVVIPLGRATDTMVTESGPVSVVDVERVLFDHVALEPDLFCEIRDRRFHILCTPIPGALARQTSLQRFMHDRLAAELGVDAALAIAGARTTKGESG